MRGASEILETAKYRLGIKTGQTTQDYKHSLERVACVGSCALAPVVMIDDEVYPRMTAFKMNELLGEQKEKPESGAKSSKK